MGIQVIVRPDPEMQSRIAISVIDPQRGSNTFIRLAHIVRISSTPTGEAPESIRKGWVGLEFPALEPDETNNPAQAPQGVLSGRSVGDYGYTVPAIIAFHLLSEKAPAAYRWWCENAPSLITAQAGLCFNFDACEVIASGDELYGAATRLFAKRVGDEKAEQSFLNRWLRAFGIS